MLTRRKPRYATPSNQTGTEKVFGTITTYRSEGRVRRSRTASQCGRDVCLVGVGGESKECASIREGLMNLPGTWDV